MLPALVQHLADLSLVAEGEGRLVGFVGGHRPQIDRRTLIVWQIHVEPTLRLQGLGTALLHALIRCPGCEGIEHVEATVDPSNLAAARLFERFAREVEASCESVPRRPSTAIAPTREDREELLRIGPINVERTMNLKGSHETL